MIGSVYANLFILLLNRPFVGPRPPAPENASELEAATALALERRCRSLAFDHCRKAALKIMELLRHLPRASPCFSTPYFIFSASTVLLLSPKDNQAIRGVLAGLKCLDELEADRYWVNAVIDARARIYALAQRWGATQIFENLAVSSPATATTIDSPPDTGYPTPPETLGSTPPPHGSYIDPTTSKQTSGEPWSNMFASSDPAIFGPENFEDLDASMYLDSLPDAADMIPWAGAVEPSWGTMGTQQAPEYTLPGWEFMASGGRGYTPYQHPYESTGAIDHSLDTYMMSLGSTGMVR